MWMTDKNGKVLNIPERTFKHSMDAISYGLDSYKPVNNAFEQVMARNEAEYIPNPYK